MPVVHASAPSATSMRRRPARQTDKPTIYRENSPARVGCAAKSMLFPPHRMVSVMRAGESLSCWIPSLAVLAAFHSKNCHAAAPRMECLVAPRCFRNIRLWSKGALIALHQLCQELVLHIVGYKRCSQCIPVAAEKVFSIPSKRLM